MTYIIHNCTFASVKKNKKGGSSGPLIAKLKLKNMLVQFETAKLAKEKGCNIPTYIPDDEINGVDILITQSELQDWLIDTYDIEVEVFSVYNKDKKWYRVYVKQCGVVKWNPSQIQNISQQYTKRHLALEEALLIALKFI